VMEQKKGVKIGIVSLGSCDGAVREARDLLGKQNIDVNYCRVRAFPFTDEVEAFLKMHERVFVVEQNRDAQLKSLLILETGVEKEKLTSILHYNGMPIDSRCIVEGIIHSLDKGAAA
ncbi:MAG: 2-oxoacid:acceptor oxidoreductase subunit alpha, partial [Gammaproteobacteria bacterium]|nr:2-oxoacid:acceptor oxidoreductase subunit alpha [Gammaproteobacteria bacterium]